MRELYITIEGYENYEVSNFGNVRNKKTNYIRNLCIDDVGYYGLTLKENKKSKRHRIHRLVAEAFIPNPNKKLYVDHKDGNPLNNNVKNLRWCTNQENSMNSKIRNDNTSGVKGVRYNKLMKKWEPRICVNGKDISLGYFDDIKDAIKTRQEKAREGQGEFTHECEKC